MENEREKGRDRFPDVLSPTFSSLVNKRRDLGQVSYLSYKGEHAWNDIHTDSEVKQTSNPQEERGERGMAGMDVLTLAQALATNSAAEVCRPRDPASS